MFARHQHPVRRYTGFKNLPFFFKTIVLMMSMLLFTVSIINIPDTWAADPKQKLSDIQRKIKSKLKQVRESKQKEKSVLERIDDIEKGIRKKEKDLRHYDKQIFQTQAEIAALSKDIDQLNSDLDSRKVHLKERLRSLYKQQYGGHALILISAKDYQDLIKKSKYISLIAHYDSRLINKYSSDIAKTMSKQKKLVLLNEKLNKNKKAAEKMQKALQTDRIKKDKLLSMIRSKQRSYEKSIRELKASSRKLREMMKKLKKKKLPKSIIGKGFKPSKGRLPWPVNGKVVVPYGKYMDPEFKVAVFKNGIEIKPDRGERPRAIAGGRVVYADWFKGYGLLLIIDHGSGYHSLYGNLSEVFLETGNIIIPGTVVGKAGKSRQLNFPTVYFEIRHKGKPVNPMQWLKRRVRLKRR